MCVAHGWSGSRAPTARGLLRGAVGRLLGRPAFLSREPAWTPAAATGPSSHRLSSVRRWTASPMPMELFSKLGIRSTTGSWRFWTEKGRMPRRVVPATGRSRLCGHDLGTVLALTLAAAKVFCGWPRRSSCFPSRLRREGALLTLRRGDSGRAAFRGVLAGEWLTSSAVRWLRWISPQPGRSRTSTKLQPWSGKCVHNPPPLWKYLPLHREVVSSGPAVHVVGSLSESVRLSRVVGGLAARR